MARRGDNAAGYPLVLGFTAIVKFIYLFYSRSRSTYANTFPNYRPELEHQDDFKGEYVDLAMAAIVSEIQ